MIINLSTSGALVAVKPSSSGPESGGNVVPTNSRIIESGVGPFGAPAERPTLVMPGVFVVGSSAGGLPSGKDY